MAENNAMHDKLTDQSDFDAGWDGECEECHKYSDNMVHFPMVNVYLCPSCLSEARFIADRW